MRAVLIEGPWRAAVRNLPEPISEVGQVIVRPQYVGLCGTDLELLAGTMPYFDAGVAHYPIQPGHEVSALTVDRTARWEAGTRVVIDPVIGCGTCPACTRGVATLCDAREELGIRLGRAGGAAELLSVPESNLYRIPDGVRIEHAPLVEPGVTALHAVDRIVPESGQQALVIGAGTLGGIAAQLLASRGVTVEMPVLDRARAEFVEAIGGIPVSDVRSASYDLVIEAAGTHKALHWAIDGARPGASVALIGIQAGPVDQVEVNQMILKNLRVHGIINGSGLYEAMLEEIASGAVDVRALIDRDYPLVDLAAALTRLQDQSRSRPKVLLRIYGA